jgi:hypothetical protein
MIRFAVVISALVAVSANTLAAQTVDKPRIFAALGLGAAAPASGGDGIANMAQIVFEKKSHHVALRGLIVHDIDRATNELGEIGVLYGRVSPVRSYPVAIAAGVSGVGFSACPDDDDSCFTIGIPVAAEVSWRRRLIGFGLQGFGNFNSKASYAGAVLFLQLGRLTQ